MENAVLQRRLDVAYVARGGVLQSFESINDFLCAVEVEPDVHTIQTFLNRKSGKRDSVPNLQREGEDAVVASPRQQRVPLRRVLVSITDCVALAKQCMEVQRRKLVGGNEAHYLQLAWAGCGGDDDRKGLIPKYALIAQLEAFGVATEDTTAAGFASDSEEPPQMSFHDLVGLVSVSKNVLDIASKCHDLSRIPAMLTKQVGRHVSSEESKLMHWQAMALVRFKLRLRLVIHRRRKKKREEEALRASQAAMTRSTSMRQGGRGGIVGARSQRRSSVGHPGMVLPPLVASSSLTCPPPPQGVSGALSSRVHAVGEGRDPPPESSPMPSPARGGNPLPPHVDLGDPSILHDDTSSCPWHRAHPFESTKLQKDWVALSPPVPAARRGGNRLGSSQQDTDTTSSRRRDGHRGNAESLGQLRQRLRVLLQEQQQHLAASIGNSGGAHNIPGVVRGGDASDSEASEQESPALSIDGDKGNANNDNMCVGPLDDRVGNTGAPRVVSFSSALVASTSVSSVRRLSSCGIDVACQCSPLEILATLHGASVAPSMLRRVARQAAGTKARRPLLPPLPHAGKWKKGAL